VKGIVLEAFGVGNFPDLPQQGWVPWLRQQTRKGLQVGPVAAAGLMSLISLLRGHAMLSWTKEGGVGGWGGGGGSDPQAYFRCARSGLVPRHAVCLSATEQGALCL
jgi:hypothetical protein